MVSNFNNISGNGIKDASMRKLIVTWEINSELSCPVEAAREAFATMQRPGTEATVFEVLDQGTGEKFRVDLLEEEPVAEKIV